MTADAATFTGQDDWPCTCGHLKKQHFFGDGPTLNTFCQLWPNHCQNFRPASDLEAALASQPDIAARPEVEK